MTKGETNFSMEITMTEQEVEVVDKLIKKGRFADRTHFVETVIKEGIKHHRSSLGRDIRIRKVRVLGSRARAECDRQGLDENDLVEVETIIHGFRPAEFIITKIECSPLQFLKDKYLQRVDE